MHVCYGTLGRTNTRKIKTQMQDAAFKGHTKSREEEDMMWKRRRMSGRRREKEYRMIE